jgi:hypothetical protein
MGQAVLIASPEPQRLVLLVAFGANECHYIAPLEIFLDVN